MHGLVNRSIQSFLRDTYGPALWEDIVAAAGLPSQGFEALLTYDDRLTFAMLAEASRRLGRTEEALLEDLGTYLISHPGIEWLRRLLRFGGVTFIDFLNSLDQLPDRARMAVPELDLPELDLREAAPGRFVLSCRHRMPAIAQVLVGVLRAMADDYGALVLLDAHAAGSEEVLISIDVAAARLFEGRRFELAAG